MAGPIARSDAAPAPVLGNSTNAPAAPKAAPPPKLVTDGAPVARPQPRQGPAPLSPQSVVGLRPPNPVYATPAPWSHTPGASGNPLMTVEAIESAAANFGPCIEGLRTAAVNGGVSDSGFTKLTAGLTPDLGIMDKMDRQPEFSWPPWQYMKTLVTDERATGGKALLEAHAGAFDDMEKKLGVDRHIVASLWGIESDYGKQIGDRPVLQSMATLACVGRRQNYFRNEFLATLQILDGGHVKPDDLRGSWAGAFGPTQFMPTSWKEYAVDGDGDGKRDIVNSIPDIIQSTANNLKKDGWVTGAPVLDEVTLPANFDFVTGRGRKTIAQWEGLGVRPANGGAFVRPSDSARLILPAGAQGPAILARKNFEVIRQYNPSDMYATAMAKLADRLRGGEGEFKHAWPTQLVMPTEPQRREIQERLASSGHYSGIVDGKLGAKSTEAIQAYQIAHELVPDGFATAQLLEYMRTH